jgi:hypothetical protein
MTCRLVLGLLIAAIVIALLVYAVHQEKKKWRPLSPEELKRILDFADGQTWPPTDIH